MISPHAAILLAAGASKRLGCPKQLLPWNGQPLIRHIALMLLQTAPRALVIVTGAFRQDITAALAGLDWTEAYAPDWTEGMGASLRQGLRTLMASSTSPTGPSRAAGGALVAACDQPFLTPTHLRALLAAGQPSASQSESGSLHDVVTRYGRDPDTAATHTSPHKSAGQGVPVFLSPATCARAHELSGDQGFRRLWRTPPLSLNQPALALDIDTPADWAQACALKEK